MQHALENESQSVSEARRRPWIAGARYLRRNKRMGMYRAMTVLSVIGALAALYFLYQYGMY